jgi:ComF family protein
MMRILNNFINLFFPRFCLLCGNPLSEHEPHICLYCLFDLPETNYHRNKNNPVQALFAGFPQVNEVTAFLFFEKDGKARELIHLFKYYGNKSLAEYLGRIAAIELKEYGFYASVDAIIPIPLHPNKEKKRGYNQCELIANGIASVYGCSVDRTTVRRITDTVTQTRKSGYERHLNVEKIFELTDVENLSGKHILLVDDVITTGATTSACIETLAKIPEIKISLFSIAITREY